MSINGEKKLEFQIIDWNAYHEIDTDECEKYVVQLFGRSQDDKDVCIKVEDYTPNFYVEIPNSWNETHIESLVESLKYKISRKCSGDSGYDTDLSESIIGWNIVYKHKYYGFTNKAQYKFAWFTFKSHTGMREFSSALYNPVKIRIGKSRQFQEFQFDQFESNIEPHIRLMHTLNISSCGWVEIAMSDLIHIPEYSKCDHSYSVIWDKIKPSKNDDRIAPFKIMAYDIECNSCDHSFPQAERQTDEIFQIGMTIYRYGSMTCEEEYLLTLKQSYTISGAKVECFRKERSLIKRWQNLYQK